MTYAWESMAREDIWNAMRWGQEETPDPYMQPAFDLTYEVTARGNTIASFPDWQGKMQYAQIIVIAQQLTEEEYEAIEWGSDG